MRSAVAILSGGLDSTTSVAIAISKGIRFKHAIFFNYGQGALPSERRSSKAIAHYYGIDFVEIALPFIHRITSARIIGRREPPAFSKANLKDLDFQRKTAAAVWVPNRNGIFINVAAAFAESTGGNHPIVVTGFNAEEAATFPDNSLTYVMCVNRALHYSTRNHVEVISFTQNMTKAQIVERGLALEVPLNLIWSCYRSGAKPCRRCESCVRSAAAYEAAGATQKSRYA